MNINFKYDVSYKKLNKEMFIAIFEIAKIYEEKNLPLTITSTTEKAPGRLKNSLHYHGLAIDIRIWRLTEYMLNKLFREISRRLKKLSTFYQVVLKKDHIHIEYDIGVNINGQI